MARAPQRLAAVTLALLAVAAFAAIPATARGHDGRCRDADVPAGRAGAPEMRAAVVCLINKAREARGLPPLQSSSKLNRAAQSWTEAMVATGNFSEGDPGARVSAVGFSWSTVGENIAMGYGTPRQVVAAWMASQGHCENILDPIYTNVGTGVDRGAVRGSGSHPGTWTQDFGLPMGRRSPSGDWGPASHCPY